MRMVRRNLVLDRRRPRSESMTFTLSNPSGATLADAQATGTIADDDAAPVAELTARFENTPAEHDGSSAFKLRVAFSEATKIAKRNFQDHSVAVAGGSVTNARRVDQHRDLWEVTRASPPTSLQSRVPPSSC